MAPILSPKSKLLIKFSLSLLAGAIPTDLTATSPNEPHLKDSLTTPIATAEGHTATLTCVVRNLGKNTLIWKFGNKILTAGGARITSDERISVIHDKGLFPFLCS